MAFPSAQCQCDHWADCLLNHTRERERAGDWWMRKRGVSLNLDDRSGPAFDIFLRIHRFEFGDVLGAMGGTDEFYIGK